MNKKQLCVVWVALLMLTSMVWFPGRWFDFIVEGYPVIKPDSVEFLVRIFAPIGSLALFIIYLLRDRKESVKNNPLERTVDTHVFKSVLMLTLGVFLGLFIGYFLLKMLVLPEQVVVNKSRGLQIQDSEFKEFCKKEGYREEVENLTDWLMERQAREVAVLYNVDDAHSAAVYKYFSQNLDDGNVKIIFSDTYKQGEKSFHSRLKIIESHKPEAIIFLGSYEERIAFLEDISHRSQLTFWESRLDEIKWVE